MSKKTQESFLISKARQLEKCFGLETEIKWTMSILGVAYHVLAIYWCYHYALPVKWQSLVFAYVMFVFSAFGITGGAHRYWAHRTFKAATPLRIIFVLGFSCAGQYTLYKCHQSVCVSPNRVHHKYSDTDADPHNIERGIFFAHIGWFFMKKKREVTSKFNQIDMSDIDRDPFVAWHTRYVYIINAFALIIPTLFGVLVWDEPWRVAVAWQCFIRPLIVYHIELSVNSFAHSTTSGYRPYNKSIRPVENTYVAILSTGEGWHNYHHTFPFDYKAAEWHHTLDITTSLLLLAEKCGWLTDKREASKEMIQKYIDRHVITDKDNNVKHLH